MGWGDEIMVTGEARALKNRAPHTKILVGDGNREFWSEIFEGNPAISRRRDINAGDDVVWLRNYPGIRPYVDTRSSNRDRVKFLPYQPQAGELVFSEKEKAFAQKSTADLKDFILIEPHVKGKFSALNKDWGWENWLEVATLLGRHFQLVQVGPSSTVTLPSARLIVTKTFREACAVLRSAKLFVGTEGGLHHASAALAVPAVVIYGGYISPRVTGYETQISLYSGEAESVGCGTLEPCEHCLKCMSLIAPAQVLDAVAQKLSVTSEVASALKAGAQNLKWQTPKAWVDALAQDKQKKEGRDIHRYRAAVKGRLKDMVLRWAGRGERILSFVMKPFNSGQIVFFIQLVEDLDVLLPLAMAAKARGLRARFVATQELIQRSPRVSSRLATAGLPWKAYPQKSILMGLFPRLTGVASVVSATESSAGPHRTARALAVRANAQGIQTFTLQHGLDCVGLTYFDNKYSAESVSFESGTIFLWGDLETLDPRVPPVTRKKCVAVGCLKNYTQLGAQAPPALSTEGRPIVAVFENLHWERYDEAFRAAFLSDLFQMVAENPDLAFVLKPHHSGRWFSERYEGRIPIQKNLFLIDPRDPRWEPFTAPDLIRMAAMVVTTPSTVAFDAASMGKPVTVASYGLPLERYAPLPILQSTKDWSEFLAAPLETLELGRAFLSRTQVSGDALARALSQIAPGSTERSPAVRTRKELSRAGA